MKLLFIICNIFSFIFLCCIEVQGENLLSGNDIVISLSDYNQSLTNGQAFYNNSILNSLSETSINIINIPPIISFVIIQVHTQELNVTLSSNSSRVNNVFGYNIGLQINSSNINESNISVRNNNEKNVEVLVAVVAYESNAPIPGGCNMEFNVEIAPYQEIYLNNATLTIEAQPASTPIINNKQISCEKNLIKYQSYRLYISEGDFTNKTYFSTLIKMLTVDDIIKYSEISSTISTSLLRRVYSVYPGTGSVYVIIATYNNYSAAYVPSFSYACGPVSNSETCYTLKTSLSKFLCALIFFIGLFFIFFGYRYLTFEVIFLGSITGGILGDVILNACGFHDSTWHIVLVIVIGLIVGIFCAFCWYAEKPCLTILQASFSLGTLIASVIYLVTPDNLLFKNDALFWSIYVIICLGVTLLLCACSMSSIIICYSILGSYAIILPIDYWLGSNLKYIVINTVRRINVNEFNSAIINPPFQAADIYLTVIWILLAILGFIIQNRGLKGRLPFSFTTKYTTIASQYEYPTISAERGNRRVLILKKNDHVYQSM